ncbi:MAG: AMP-binding protein [Bacteroidales bacterium]|nr:AMP-binding protein [Bacteroidales bacterium]MCF8327394.1 AMP-binding protein [Bacteroidales bacterium]
MKIFHTLPAVIRETAKEKGSNVAFTTVGKDEKITYSQAVDHIDSIIRFLEEHDIHPGDRVAILSVNMPNWALVYFAIASMGAVVVPLLPDFSENEISNTLKHSDAKAIFVSKGLTRKLNGLALPQLNYQFAIEDFSEINDHGRVSFDIAKKPENNYVVEEEQLATIIYTSGTTGESKGVMLSHKNVVFNAIQAGIVQPINENDRFLSILPLSHTYENTLGLILPVIYGAQISYISKPPTPGVLLPALKKVRPTVMLTVPLIIEKIYKSKVRPVITKNKFTRHLYAVGPLRRSFNRMIGKKLMKTFGGELKFFGIGGAKLDGVVEQFLLEAKFPYAIGYGLTETAPLAAGVNPQTTRWQSTGPAIQDGEVKVNDPDPKTGEGEIWIRGPHVMMGYYKNPEKTKEIITDDGWFRTGDLGKFSDDGFLYIKGRLKNMIVGSSGENIYPEEIESIINNFNHVLESVVVEKKGKLVAMVHFNQQELEEKYHDFKEELTEYVEQKKQELQDELLNYVNRRVNRFSRVQLIQVYSEPFQKTATHKIKRFLYMEKNGKY